jgi:hypothetical protein
MEEFKIRLIYDSIFSNNDNMDVVSLFNIFLNNYLRIVYSSFPLIKILERSKSRQWITMGVKTSCKDSNNKYDKQCCKILARVIT